MAAGDDLSAVTESLTTLGSGAPTWALFVSAGAIIIAAILGARWQRKIARQTLTYNTTMEQLWDKDYIEQRTIFIGIRDGEGSEVLASLAEKNNETEEESTAIRLIMNNYELIAIGIKTGVLDENMLKLYSHKLFCHDFERMRPFINEVRKSWPKVYIEYEELYEKWRREL